MPDEGGLFAWARRVFGLPESAAVLPAVDLAEAGRLALEIARHAAGAGGDALRVVPLPALEAAIAEDRRAGRASFLFAQIDDPAALAGLCRREGVWLHVPAGAAAGLPGMELADSAAVDLHACGQGPGALLLVCAGAAACRETAGGDAGAPDLRLDLADRLAAKGRITEARDQYLALLARDPSHRLALNRLGTLLFGSGYRTAARTAFAEAVARHPGDAASHANLGRALLDAGDFPAAREQFEAALRIEPADAGAHQGLAYALMELGDEAGAEGHRRRGFEDRPMAPLPYRGEGSPVRLLLLISALGGNIPVRNLLDDRVFETTVLAPEFYPSDAPLPPHQVVFNAIGDADLDAPALQAAERLLAGTAARVINRPAAVIQTGRANHGRLRGVPGVRIPRTEILPREALCLPDAEEELARRGFAFPLLVRTPGFQTGRHFVRVERPGDLPPAIADLPGRNLLVIEFLNARGAGGKVRKYRVMTIGGRLFPLHLAVSANWKVHYFTADMADRPEHRAEDAAFLADMPVVLGLRAMQALSEIQAILGLDYGGIDFGLSAEGEVLLFEANAAMVVNPPDPDARWAYRRPAVERIFAAVRAMLTADWCAPLGAPSGPPARPGQLRW